LFSSKRIKASDCLITTHKLQGKCIAYKIVYIKKKTNHLNIISFYIPTYKHNIIWVLGRYCHDIYSIEMIFKILSWTGKHKKNYPWEYHSRIHIFFNGYSCSNYFSNILYALSLNKQLFWGFLYVTCRSLEIKMIYFST